MSGQLPAPAALPSEKEPPVPIGLGGWVGPRAGLDDTEVKFLPSSGLELRPLGRPALEIYKLNGKQFAFVYILFIRKVVPEKKYSCKKL
jgi:hypothetical protein